MTIDINLLRSRLETERKRLMQELERLKANVCPAGERSSPWAKEHEYATEISELERRCTLEKCLGDQLAEVEHALHKLDRGTYGLCDNCGQRIDPARLEALPRANLCLSCRAQEKKAKIPPARQERRVAYFDEKVTLPLTIADWLEELFSEVKDDKENEEGKTTG